MFSMNLWMKVLLYWSNNLLGILVLGLNLILWPLNLITLSRRFQDDSCDWRISDCFDEFSTDRWWLPTSGGEFSSSLGGFHLHLLIFPFVYQLYTRLKCKWTRKGKGVDETFYSPLGASPTWPIMGFVKTPSTLASNNQRTSSNSLNKSKTNSSKFAEYNAMCKWPT